MVKKLTLWARFSQQFFAIPAVAQLWAKRTIMRTDQMVDLAGDIPLAALGHPLGERQQSAQQCTLIFAALRLLLDAKQPGLIAEPGYRWKREIYTEPDWTQLITRARE